MVMSIISQIISECNSYIKSSSFSNYTITSKPLAVIAISITSVVLPLIYFKRVSSSQQQQQQKQQKLSKPSHQKLRNVFDVKQRNPLSSSSSSKNQGRDEKEKPFVSSYYYAHNNPKSTGGYKDGLTREDYVMNEPRLLSRNGIPVKRNATTTDHDEHEEEVKIKSTTRNIVKGRENSFPINRYLWHDEGGKDCISTIYIQNLPGRMTNSPALKWVDAGITKNDVMVKLVGSGEKKGLMIQIRKSTGSGCDDDESRQCYHLHVPQLYGEAKAVKTIVNRKKLIVKITKKKSTAWPQLPAKSSSCVDYVDEDLFRSLD